MRSLGFLAGAQSLKMPDTLSPSGPILLPLKDICRSFCCLATSANTWQVHIAGHSTTNRATTTQLQLPWPLRCLSKSIQSQWTSGCAWAAAVLLHPVTSKAESIAGAFRRLERTGTMWIICLIFDSLCAGPWRRSLWRSCRPSAVLRFCGLLALRLPEGNTSSHIYLGRYGHIGDRKIWFDLKSENK